MPTRARISDRPDEPVAAEACRASGLQGPRITDDAFLDAFEPCRLPRVSWTHAAHVRMAWLYLRRGPIDRVIPAVRERIGRLNLSFGGRPAAYHETITVAYLRLIGDRMTREPEVATFAEFSARNPDLLDRTLAALHVHYRRETLLGPAARAAYVEPDLSPLPGPWGPAPGDAVVIDLHSPEHRKIGERTAIRCDGDASSKGPVSAWPGC